MDSFNKLLDITKSSGIMLTLRYVTERDTFALLLHIDKSTSIGAEGNTLDEVCNDALDQCNKKAL